MNNLPIETYESVVQQRDALAKQASKLNAEKASLIESFREIYMRGLTQVNDDLYKWEFFQTPEELIEQCIEEANEAGINDAQ